MLTYEALWQLPAEGLFLYILLISIKCERKANLLRTGEASIVYNPYCGR